MNGVLLLSLCYLPLLGCFALETIETLWILFGVLDEAYIARWTLLTFACVCGALTFLASALTSIVYWRNAKTALSISSRGQLPPACEYAFTSLLLSTIQVFVVVYFNEKSVLFKGTLDTHTFADVEHYRTILVYRDVLLMFVSFWAVRALAASRLLDRFQSELQRVRRRRRRRYREEEEDEEETYVQRQVSSARRR